MKKINFLLGLCAVVPLAHSATVDLSTWTVENWSVNAGNWVVASGGGSVLQTINGNPTVFLSDQSALGTDIQGTIQVRTTSDDDFIGFVLGFNSGDFSNSAADYLLIDWKQGTQNAFGANAPAGLAVSRVDGVVGTLGEFWGHGGAVSELARGTTLGNTGWSDNVSYTFGFEFSSTNLKVSVNGNEEINVNGTFPGGNLGFYNFSQAQVEYSGFTQDDLPPPTNTVPDGGSGIALLGTSLLGLGFVRKRLLNRQS